MCHYCSIHLFMLLLFVEEKERSEEFSSSFLFYSSGREEGREGKSRQHTAPPGSSNQQPAASSQQPHIILFFKQLLQISLVQFPDSANYFDQVPSITHICFCFNLFTFYFFHPMHLFNILISLPSWCLVCFLRSKFIEIPTLSYIGFVSFRFTFSYGAPP